MAKARVPEPLLATAGWDTKIFKGMDTFQEEMGMSLRTKLYFGFIVMISLAMVIGGVAIYAFYNTEVQVEKSDMASTELVNVAIPVNEIASGLASNVAAAGFFIHGYAYSGSEDDYRRGAEFIGKVRDTVARLDELLKSLPDDKLPKSRQM